MTSNRPTRRRKPAQTIPTPNTRAIIARRLDMMAGIELQHGHHLAAERLAWRAEEMREAGR